MKKFLVPVLTAGLLWGNVTSPARAQSAAPAPARPAPAGTQSATGQNMQADIVRAETYLQKLGTAKARFLQTAPNGQQLLGTFYLSRPGRLRFEYDAPVRDFVVADGFFIYFYDAALGEQSNAPIGQTLADFLLRPELRLSGDIKVTETRRSGGLLLLTLVQAKDPGAGSLTLGFAENPSFQLKKWRIVDASGAIVEVELFQLEEGVKLARNLFHYAAPTDGRPRYN